MTQCSVDAANWIMKRSRQVGRTLWSRIVWFFLGPVIFRFDILVYNFFLVIFPNYISIIYFYKIEKSNVSFWLNIQKSLVSIYFTSESSSRHCIAELEFKFKHKLKIFFTQIDYCKNVWMPRLPPRRNGLILIYLIHNFILRSTECFSTLLEFISVGHIDTALITKDWYKNIVVYPARETKVDKTRSLDMCNRWTQW